VKEYKPSLMLHFRAEIRWELLRDSLGRRSKRYGFTIVSISHERSEFDCNDDLIIRAMRFGTVHSGLTQIRVHIDRLAIEDFGIEIQAKMSDVPRLLWNKYLTQQVLELRC
jgi:hypothetical protein